MPRLHKRVGEPLGPKMCMKYLVICRYVYEIPAQSGLLLTDTAKYVTVVCNRTTTLILQLSICDEESPAQIISDFYWHHWPLTYLASSVDNRNGET